MTAAAGNGNGIPQGIPGLDKEQHEAMLALLADLRYPVGPRGEVLMIMEPMAPIVAFHLTRAGWRPAMAKRKIKPRRPFGDGLIEDATTWVPIDAPDDPLANLASMTMGQINALPDELRMEARRRLGFQVPPAQQPPGWQVRPHVTITDEDEPPDDEEQP